MSDEIEQVFVKECGCIRKTSNAMEHLPYFMKRWRMHIVTTFCSDHKEEYHGDGFDEKASFTVKCWLCQTLLWFAIFSMIFTGVFGFIVARQIYR